MNTSNWENGGSVTSKVPSSNILADFPDLCSAVIRVSHRIFCVSVLCIDEKRLSRPKLRAIVTGVGIDPLEKLSSKDELSGIETDIECCIACPPLKDFSSSLKSKRVWFLKFAGIIPT